MSQLSGEVATAVAPAGLLAMSQFLKLMLDPFAGTRGEAGGRARARLRAGAPRAGASGERLCRVPPVPQGAGGDAARRSGAGPPGARPMAATAARGDLGVGSHDRTCASAISRPAPSIASRPTPWSASRCRAQRANFGLEQRARQRPRRNLAGRRLRRLAVRQLLSGGVARRHRTTTCRPSASCRCRRASQLTACYGASGFGARIEGGRRFVDAELGITPFVAVQVQTVRTAAYNERCRGWALPALGYSEETTSRLRSEVGTTFDAVSARCWAARCHWYWRMAWAHEYWRDNSINAPFPVVAGIGLHRARRDRAGRRAAARAAPNMVRQRPGGATASSKPSGEFRHTFAAKLRRPSSASSVDAPTTRNMVTCGRSELFSGSAGSGGGSVSPRTFGSGAADAEHLAHRRQRRVRHRGVTFGGRMDGAAIDRAKHAPDRIVDARPAVSTLEAPADRSWR